MFGNPKERLEALENSNKELAEKLGALEASLDTQAESNKAITAQLDAIAASLEDMSGKATTAQVEDAKREAVATAENKGATLEAAIQKLNASVEKLAEQMATKEDLDASEARAKAGAVTAALAGDNVEPVAVTKHEPKALSHRDRIAAFNRKLGRN